MGTQKLAVVGRYSQRCFQWAMEDAGRNLWAVVPMMLSSCLFVSPVDRAELKRSGQSDVTAATCHPILVLRERPGRRAPIRKRTIVIGRSRLHLVQSFRSRQMKPPRNGRVGAGGVVGISVIKQKIAQIVGNEKIAHDVWPTHTGFAVLAHTPAQAATISAKAKEVEVAFGSAKVERQEIWVTFIVGPIPKRIRMPDGMVDPVADGHLRDEVQPGSEAMPSDPLHGPTDQQIPRYRRDTYASPSLYLVPRGSQPDCGSLPAR